MKAVIFFFAISVSLILTSCSQLDQETSPVAPQMNKSLKSSNGPSFPYNYLSVFPELNSDNYFSSQEIPSYSELPEFPYNYWQRFNSILVYEWITKGETISVHASDAISNNQHVFAKINSKEGNMLVFIGKPATSSFDIPKYGDMNIEEFSLHGLSSSPFFDAQ